MHPSAASAALHVERQALMRALQVLNISKSSQQSLAPTMQLAMWVRWSSGHQRRAVQLLRTGASAETEPPSIR